MEMENLSRTFSRAHIFVRIAMLKIALMIEMDNKQNLSSPWVDGAV